MIRKLLASLAVLPLLGIIPTPASAAAPTAADFGRVPALESVTLAPDGKHLAAITSPDGVQRVISIWRTDALDQPPVVIGGNRRSDLRYVTFIKNDRLGVVVQQTWTVGNQYNGHLGRYFITDLKGENWMTALGDQDQNDTFTPTLLSSLPQDPRHILVDVGDIYKVDVYTGEKQRIERASDRYGGKQVDRTGMVRARQEVDSDSGGTYVVQQLKNPDTGTWEEHFRFYVKNRSFTEIVGFLDANTALLRRAEGRDQPGIYLYDIRARKITEPAFEHKLFGANGAVQAPNGEVEGFVYGADRARVHWVSPRLQQLDRDLRQALSVKPRPVTWTDPASGESARFNSVEGPDIAIEDMSDDRTTFLVSRSGPSLPPEYYLVREGKPVQLLGRSMPGIDTASLGEARIVQYRARDGLMIPAFLTTPPASMGPGPHPAIILPHGGPWARDSLDWDSSGWTQFFAARGYTVIQPQFRGSEGWGVKLWRAGDAQWGLKMQDDLDDAAAWLVQQGHTTADRIAIHGYSYGGYAAMAAAVRANNVYQCAVPGAGVAGLADIQRETFSDSRFLREFQRPTIDGLDPLKLAGQANIPVLLYHGDRDTIVDVSQSDDFNAALRRNGKSVKYIRLKDMGHTSNTWTPEHARVSLTAIEAFLKNDCGPGGL